MKKTRILILGAGISGLSLAHFLSSHSDQLDIVILEKGSRSGGWLKTDTSQGFLFEKGPRTFRTRSSRCLLQLVNELGLEKKLIGSDESAKVRYLYINGKLAAFPRHPLAFLSSVITRDLIWPFLKEWSVPAEHPEDESIYAFAARRLGDKAARRLFDPLVLGIYAGDIHTLSIRACFSILKEWEEEYGSLTKGFLASLKHKKPHKEEPFFSSLRGSSLFSFEGGTQTLIDALEKKSAAKIYFEEEVQALKVSDKGVEVSTQNQTWTADFLFSCLPVSCMQSLFLPLDEEISHAFSRIHSKSIGIINLGFHQRVLTFKGFGYLIPTSENEEILGCVFDSNIFPQHNQAPQETRLTLMIKEPEKSKAAMEEIVQKALKRHLAIIAKPDVFAFEKAAFAIPQYPVGHLNLIQNLEERLRRHFPRIYLAGNYLSGPSVEACIARVKMKGEEFIKESIHSLNAFTVRS